MPHHSRLLPWEADAELQDALLVSLLPQQPVSPTRREGCIPYNKGVQDGWFSTVLKILDSVTVNNSRQIVSTEVTHFLPQIPTLRRGASVHVLFAKSN